jgi:hypothetical protein
MKMGLDPIGDSLGRSAGFDHLFEEAEKIAQGNPYIASIRVYEIMSHSG